MVNNLSSRNHAVHIKPGSNNVAGLWMAALCLSAFSIVMFGFGDGNLGTGCNSDYSEECDLVFRARSTTFVCLTWFALFLAWEMSKFPVLFRFL